MKTFLALTIIVVLTAAIGFGAYSPSLNVSAVRTPTPAPTPWPDLSMLTGFKNPSGNKCGINGAGTTPEKKALNRLKNRFRLPSGAFESIAFDDLIALNQGHPNCNTTVKRLCDTHINVLPEQGVSSADGRNTYVVEVTERIRRLAAQGLLTSNIGNNWSTDKLKEKLEGHKVRFSGFLFFDTDHADQAFVSDPQDNIGGSNFRQTAWEIHPVMRIEVLH